MDKREVGEFLENYFRKYNNKEFIANDPIQIPHRFTKKEDIEIAGFLTASIAWGNRSVIIRNAYRIMELMDFSPFDFIQNCSGKDLKRFEMFKHRTFQPADTSFFIKSLQNIYRNHQGLENIFEQGFKYDAKHALMNFNRIFNSIPHLKRSEKHLANPLKNSAAKRLNMFLRWMIRSDMKGVDFGLWKNISPSKLMLPLDVHSARIGRELGLLDRKQNDWKAVEEITKNLRFFDKNDPAKYDFALFGYGVNY